MSHKVPVLMAALLACAFLTLAAVAWASETLTIHASFNPDKLGSPTNISATGEFHSAETGGVPSPMSKVAVYLPAGLQIDVHGAGTCAQAALQAGGPSACPANSRIGFGGGTGSLELGKEVIYEPYTVDLFLASKEPGHLALLAFVQAISPVSLELVVVAKEIHAPSPYGLGFTVEVPPIPTIPGASNASLETVFVTVGDRNIAYYEHLHGKDTLVHLPGVVVPGTCPAGGFPYEVLVSFEDDTSLTSAGTIACPESR
jgi:hypothetical protein